MEPETSGIENNDDVVVEGILSLWNISSKG